MLPIKRPNDQPSINMVRVPSPMALVRKHTASNEEAAKAVIYFKKGGVTGRGFGNDNLPLLDELREVSKAIDDQMQGDDYFISMIPESYLHTTSENRTEVPEQQNLPDFRIAFAPVGDLLASIGAVHHHCDVRLEISTGRAYCGDPKPPRVTLSIIERVPKVGYPWRPEMPAMYTDAKRVDCTSLGVSVDPSSEDVKAILKWFAGAGSGMIEWNWKPTVSSTCQ